MKRLLIIKTGTTIPSLKQSRGDFGDWILSGMHMKKEHAHIVDVTQGTPLPPPEDLSGIAITGSHAMVTEHQPWCEATAQWLREAMQYEIPILGICYGHQLLAYAAGGIVGYNPKGMELGTVDICLKPAARDDRLFHSLPDTIQVHVSHTQSVLKLPPHATVLASNKMDPHHAFVIGDRVWGIQFHPEFDVEITRAYINKHREKLLEDGTDPVLLMDSCKDTPFGPELLQRFSHTAHQFFSDTSQPSDSIS